jgi:hypothetical protein
MKLYSTFCRLPARRFDRALAEPLPVVGEDDEVDDVGRDDEGTDFGVANVSEGADKIGNSLRKQKAP